MPALEARSKYGYIDSRIAKGARRDRLQCRRGQNTLPKLIDRALQGEEVVITRHGKPVAELRAVQRPPAPPRGTYEWMRSRRDARPGVGLTSVEILDLLSPG
jgi:antitoxin (DNA-binding transcriptional repressor) of toxin-antitoxin stability system